MAKLKWIVAFSVDETWIEDGFDIDNERALDILSKALPYANIGTELKARVIRRPDAGKIAKLQGYDSVAQWRKANATA